MMSLVEIAAALVKMVVDLVGTEKASELMSKEAIDRANLAADAVEVARELE